MSWSLYDDLRAKAGLPSEEMECLNKANDSPKVRQIDALISNLSANWHPTGYYTPADVQAIIDVLATYAADAGAMLADAPSSTGDAEELRAGAFSQALRIYADQSKNYAQAAAQAQASGVAVNAPGLRDWVVKSMLAISNVYVTAAVLQCRESLIVSILDRAYRGMAAIGEVARGILGVAYDVAKGAVNAAEAGLGLVASLLKYTKWLLIIGVSGMAIYAGLQLYRKHFAHGGLLPQLPDAWKLPD